MKFACFEVAGGDAVGDTELFGLLPLLLPDRISLRAELKTVECSPMNEQDQRHALRTKKDYLTTGACLPFLISESEDPAPPPPAEEELLSSELSIVAD